MSSLIFFSLFRLDLSNAQLWRGESALPLRPKTFSVLQYLAERPNQLATKDELLTAIWPDTVVSETALKVCIRELRQALGETARQPECIETVYKRGYRFIAEIRSSQSSAISHQQDRKAPQSPPPGPQPLILNMVGRETELAQFHTWWENALAGQRQLVFVSGEPGIGKTTLLDAFLATREPGSVWLAEGQCIEQHETGEAFLPVLEGIGRLCRQSERLVSLLREHAPSWLLQLPGLLSTADRQALQHEYAGMAHRRMLRELVIGLETLTADTPMIMVLEDLHWSDYSTLDFLSALARRRQSARLLVIGTYRPADAMASNHPLAPVAQELRLRGYCTELLLEQLAQEAIAAYLTTRFPNSQFPTDLSAFIHRQTEGNPLFMVRNSRSERLFPPCAASLPAAPPSRALVPPPALSSGRRRQGKIGKQARTKGEDTISLSATRCWGVSPPVGAPR